MKMCTSVFSFIPQGNEKNHYTRHTKMCTSGFSFIPQGNEKNQQSIIKKTEHLSLDYCVFYFVKFYSFILLYSAGRSGEAVCNS